MYQEQIEQLQQERQELTDELVALRQDLKDIDNDESLTVEQKSVLKDLIQDRIVKIIDRIDAIDQELEQLQSLEVGESNGHDVDEIENVSDPDANPDIEETTDN